jgi:hypothetical protein
MRGPKPQLLAVQLEHLEILQQNLRTGTTEQRVARRSRILLLCAQGQNPSVVATLVGCDRTTVWRVAERYKEKQLGALEDQPRPGRPAHFSPSAQGADHGFGLSAAG